MLLTIVVSILCLYLVVCAVLYVYQERFIFFPEVLPPHFTYSFPVPFEEVTWQVDGATINAPCFVPGVDFSDHLQYWAAGYQAIMITDTAFYRNPRYHTAHDTPETLDYPRMAMVVHGVYAAVLAFAHETR